ncbi:MlaD family protein [Candidatus Methylospira mobilis]|nr:MlaD family protein [Candidatus Methylospira mobilis]WNV03922.1 MlaD family protein [Candidatus Methylospira mobilis]
MSQAPKEPNKTVMASKPQQQGGEALVEKSRGLALVWVIPLIALAIGIWLAYQTLSAEGPTVTIAFREASGLEAGKSKIKYKNVEVGTVLSVELSKDLTQVLVTAKMDKHVADHIKENTVFWVVKPQFGLSGVSGMDTLLAGNYIGVEFGDGKPRYKFSGLDQPPHVSADTPGRSFLLSADSAGPLGYGTPVYFRDIQVGQAVDVKLAEDRRSVQVEIFINAPYDRLIKDGTHFWQVNAVDLSMGAQGVNLKVGSMVTLLSGGITFETPGLNDPDIPPSDADTRFRLHKDFASIAEGSYTVRNNFMLYFDDSVRGLNIGAPVEIKGIHVGTVTDIRLEVDYFSLKIRVPVIVEINPERLMPMNKGGEIKKFLESQKANIAAGRHPGLEKLIERGLRARLKTGSLITGQLYVDVDFYPDAPRQTLIYGGQYPEMPTLPSATDELMKNIGDIVANLKKLPLDKIGEELLGTVKGSNKLLNSADLKEATHSLNLALADMRHLAQTTDKQIATLSASLEKSLGSTARALEQIEPGAPMSVDISNALEELSASARSIRALTDYLERHPEALLNGKAGSGAKP